MMLVLASCAIDPGFKRMLSVFAVSLLSTPHSGESKKKLVGSRIRILYPSGATCLSAVCCFSEISL